MEIIYTLSSYIYIHGEYKLHIEIYLHQHGAVSSAIILTGVQKNVNNEHLKQQPTTTAAAVRKLDGYKIEMNALNHLCNA